MKIKNFALLLISSIMLASCSQKPEEIVSELYTSVYNGDWGKALPTILPENIESTDTNDIKIIKEEFIRYTPADRKVAAINVTEAILNEDGSEIRYSVNVNFNDSVNFVEQGILKKDAAGNWRLNDYLPGKEEKIPFEITDDFPVDMKSNLRRAVVMLGAEKNIPEYQYYAAPYYLYAPYPVEKAEYDELLKKAADANHIPAMLELASRYHSYYFGNYKMPEYVALIKKAAALGDIEAGAKLAWFQFKDDFDIPKDLAKAQEAFQKALDAGIAEGAAGLGYMYGNGLIGATDLKKALEYYKKGSEMGSSDASYNAYFYISRGKGTQRDASDADKWFVKSKAQEVGYEIKEYKPNMLFDPQVSYEMTVSAIKNGDITKYGDLGQKYELGEGVAQNTEKAKKAYIRDAALKNAAAKADIIRMRGFLKNTVIPFDEFKEIYK